MHTIDLKNIPLRTDLIIENKDTTNYKTTIQNLANIKITTTISSDSSHEYTTVSFQDVSDKDNFHIVEKTLISELKKYVDKLKLTNNDPILIIGLGNPSSTPDSLGPKAIEKVLVTRYLFTLGEVEEGYKNVSAISPGVTATTGIETYELIKSLAKDINAKLVIVIDALAASSFERLNKTIQITNTGIHPGSGVGNDRKEISEEVLGIPVIALGIPTVVDAATIVSETFKNLNKHFSFKLKNINNNKLKLAPSSLIDYSSEQDNLKEPMKKEILGTLGELSEEDFKRLIIEVLTPINYNLMVTPTEIDFLIERLSLLVANAINKTLHKDFNPTK